MSENKSAMTRLPVVAALAFICCFLWGSATPSIKTGYSLLSISSSDTPSIILFAGMRFTLAGIMTVGAGSVVRRKLLLPPKGAVKKIAALSLVQTALQYIFFYVGLAHASGVKGALMVSTNVFFSILVSALVFRSERLTLRSVLGSVIGFAGVVVINLRSGAGFDLNMSFLGEGFVVLASICYAFSANMVKEFLETEDPFTISGWQFFTGGLILCACGYCLGGRVGGWSFPAALLCYMAFISAMAYTLWSVLLKYNPVSRVSIFGFLNPLCGVLLSALILNEKEQAFNLRSLIALVLVCLGITIVNSRKEADD